MLSWVGRGTVFSKSCYSLGLMVLLVVHVKVKGKKSAADGGFFKNGFISGGKMLLKKQLLLARALGG